MARKGDTLFVPFQCDFCWFICLKKRPFNDLLPMDQMNLALIRRVNLDIFWARESTTVVGMYRLYEQALQTATHLGIKASVHRSREPWRMSDDVSFGDAMIILWRSLQRGRNNASHQQYESIRKIRSLASCMQNGRNEGGLRGTVFKDGNRLCEMSRSSTNCFVFSRFMQGCEKRMGRNIRQDAALSVDILLLILDNLEREAIMLGSFLVIGFCDALRGNEIFLVEGSSLCQYQHKGQCNKKLPHVVIPLMGRFKGETGERNVLRVLVNKTKSGIKVHFWISALIKLLEYEGWNDTKVVGPAFCYPSGEVLSYATVNGWFHSELLKVQETHSDLIPAEVDVAETFNIYRSLRRGATSRASALNYSETVINLNNRWRMTQTNKGVGGLKKMSQLYVDVSLVLESLLAFSSSL